MDAGIIANRLAPETVPLYEEHEARLERGIGVAEWMEMEETEKALIIANRRVRIAIHNLQEEAQIQKMEREAKRKR